MSQWSSSYRYVLSGCDGACSDSTLLALVACLQGIISYYAKSFLYTMLDMEVLPSLKEITVPKDVVFPTAQVNHAGPEIPSRPKGHSITMHFSAYKSLSAFLSLLFVVIASSSSVLYFKLVLYDPLHARTTLHPSEP